MPHCFATNNFGVYVVPLLHGSQKDKARHTTPSPSQTGRHWRFLVFVFLAFHVESANKSKKKGASNPHNPEHANDECAKPPAPEECIQNLTMLDDLPVPLLVPTDRNQADENNRKDNEAIVMHGRAHSCLMPVLLRQRDRPPIQPLLAWE